MWHKCHNVCGITKMFQSYRHMSHLQRCEIMETLPYTQVAKGVAVIPTSTKTWFKSLIAQSTGL